MGPGNSSQLNNNVTATNAAVERQARGNSLALSLSCTTQHCSKNSARLTEPATSTPTSSSHRQISILAKPP